MKFVKIAVIITSSVALTACGIDHARVKQINSAPISISNGDTWNKVVATLGDPEEFENYQNNVLLKYCGTNDMRKGGDPMVYIWLQDGVVREIRKDYNREYGYCHEYFRGVDWKGTLASQSLELGSSPLGRSAGRAQENNSIWNALGQGAAEAQQQNNQMMNSLIESMGQPRQQIQPQRFQTNCYRIGDMLSCN